MIAVVQTPTVRELIGALLAAPGDAGTLASPWLGSGESAYWTARGAWAIAACVQAHAMAKERMPVVWLPDYFCDEALSPLRALQCTPSFYPIGADWKPDWAACRTLAAAQPPDIFVLVHYFGLPNAAPEARTFTDAHGALLLEDAAHALAPSPGVGEEGDFVLYCPHKWFALPDGAVLIANRTSAARATTIEAALEQLGGARHRTLSWFAKRLIQMSPLASPVAAWRASSGLRFEENPLPHVADKRPRMSRAAARLLPPQIGRIAERRLANHRALQTIIRDIPGVEIPSEHAPVPYRLVVRFPDRQSAAHLFERLRRQRLPVETWPDLPAEITNDPRSHQAAIDLRHRIVLLPVHQSLAAPTLAATYREALDL